MSPSSPVVASWELVRRLRERRDKVGVEVRHITQALGFSRNYWSAVENERKILSRESLAKLLELLEFNAKEARELLALRDLAKEHGWWTSYSGLFDSEVQRMFGLEDGANEIREYESVLIPGLLQTADYARAITEPSVYVKRFEVEQRVQVRLRRQERLHDEENPLSLTTILSEAALRQQIGGVAVLRAQLEHLVDLIEQHPDNLEVRIIPFTATNCEMFGAATVHILDFENTRLPTVVWHETVTVRGLVDNPDQVHIITTAFDQALERTLDRQESLRLVHRSIKELG